MSNQPGLFPKITNIRIENQSIPNSAHSGGHNGSAAMQSAGAMNVLKNSGGHISGMSNHPNLAASNERQHHYRGMTGSGASGTNYQHQYKPLSSPRSSAQHNGHNMKEPTTNTQNDPNFIYQ
jgi:hypothetical protein